MSSAASTDARLARTLASLGHSGDLRLLDGPRRALLISRMPRHPTPATPWVRAAVAAARRSLAAGEALVTGLGRDPYEVALLLCRRENGAAIVVLDRPMPGSWLVARGSSCVAQAPSPEPQAPRSADALAGPAVELPVGCAELLPRRHLLVWPREDRGDEGRDKTARLRRRDLLIGELSDRAWEICVRPGGHMAALAAGLRARGCPVEAPDAEREKDQRDARDARNNDDDRHAEVACAAERQGKRKKEKGRSRGDVAMAALGPMARLPDGSMARSPDGSMASCPDGLLARCLDGSLARSGEWDFLTHYTREPDGPWPGEPRAAYLEWLACGPLDGRRDAADALRRILTQGRILGSGRLMPGRTLMVSFTARPPEALTELMRWRRGLRRWTFRPYGIAVRREALAALGARPVRYLPEEELKRLPPAARKFAQKHAPPRTDWSDEAEWRLRGDLDLAALPRTAVRIVVPTADEARAFAAEFGYEYWAMGG